MRLRFPKPCRRRRICKGRDLAIVDAASLRERELIDGAGASCDSKLEDSDYLDRRRRGNPSADAG